MFAFPKSARLLRPREFADVLRGPELNFSAGPLRIRARKNKLRRTRLGLVVPKRGTPKAHRRNRLKRIVRESFRRAAPQLPDADIVVQVFHDLDDERLVRLLDQQFARLSRELS